MNDKLSDKELNSIKKILIIQYKPFGDILLNTGYFETLRNKFPDAQIDFLIQRPYLTLLEDNPYLDNLVVMEKKKKSAYYLERLRMIVKVRSSRYDLVIDQLRGTGSAQITMFSGARFKLGWKLKRWNWVYNYKTIRKNDRYYARMKFDMLAPLGIKEEPHNTFYKIKDKSMEKIDNWLQEVGLKPKEFVVCSPGTPVLKKQWSLDYYAKVIDMIQEKNNLKVVMLWGPGEEKDVEIIKSKMKGEPVVAIPTTFNEAAALLKRSLLFLGNDGGINHVAISVQTPSIAVFGPHSNPKKWQAWHKPEHIYLRNWDCKDSNDRTLGVSPEAVYEKFEQIIELIR